MEPWEIALNKFLDDWRDRDEVVGALVCGSFVTGDPTGHSDIDVHIVLAAGTEWRERGNRIVDGFLIEYFANPPAQIRAYLQEGTGDNRRMEAVQFTTGRILFDKDGTVQKMKDEALRWIAEPFEPMSDTAIELAKYGLWDRLDDLQDAHEQRAPDVAFQYHFVLAQAYQVYARFLGQSVQGVPKTYKCLMKPQDAQRKYLMDPFPDQDFLDLFAQSITQTESSGMVEYAEKLSHYVLDKLGGFSIDGWAFRSPAKK